MRWAGACAVTPMVIADLALAFLAAYVTLDLAKRLERKLPADSLGWLAGAALALGTGLWACGVLGLSHLSLPYALSYHPGLIFAGWLAGVRLA